MQVRDYDPNEMGRLEITCENDAFSATEKNGEISLKVAKLGAIIFNINSKFVLFGIKHQRKDIRYMENISVTTGLLIMNPFY